jgi:hypothetical protein
MMDRRAARFCLAETLFIGTDKARLTNYLKTSRPACYPEEDRVRFSSAVEVCPLPTKDSS